MNAVPPSASPDLDALAQRARFDLAIAAAGIGTFDWDLGSGDLVWDDRLIAMFGLTAQTFDRTIDTFADRLHPDDRDRVLQVLDEAIGTGQPFEVEYRVVWPSGEMRWIEARGQCVFGPTGRPVRFLGAALDSTDLREGQARVGRVLESMPTAFLSVDRQWRLTYINAEAERLLGEPRTNYLARPLWDAFRGLADSAFGAAFRQALATGTPQVAEGPAPMYPDSWVQARAFPTPDGLALYVIDLTAAHQRQELLALEGRVGQRMAEALDLQGAVRELARLVLPRLGDWSLVTVTEPDGAVRDLASWHVDPALRPVVAQYAQHRLDGLSRQAPILQARDTGEPQVIACGLTAAMRPLLASERAWQALDTLRPESAVVVPLVARGQLVGMLSVCRGPSRPAMGEDELAVAVSLARRAAMALDNARLYADQRAAAERLQLANARLRRSVVHERTVARALQDAMLTRLPRTATVELAARYFPAGNDVQVGGDWYDALMLPDGAKAFMIGDVVGHDIGAAAMMGQLRNLLRAFLYDRQESPADTVARLDRAVRDLELQTLATLQLFRIDPPTASPRLARWTSAGHPPPILVGADGTARFLDQIADPLIGVLPEAKRSTQCFELQSGSTLLLYTDGLIERPGVELDARRRQLLDRVHAHVHEPLGDLLDAVTADLVGEDRRDDVALLGARFR